MKVHHIINDIEARHGGAQNLVRSLHEGLRSFGLDSRLLTLTDSSGDAQDGCRSLGASSPYDARSVNRLFSYIRRHCGKADFIHAHLFPTMLFASIAVRLARWKGTLVCTEHSTNNRRRATATGRLIDAVLYSRYDHVVCISQGVKTALADWKPSLSPVLTVIENGVPLPFTEFRARPPAARLVVVSVGRLNKVKNFDTALRAVSLIKSPDFEYRIAGVGPEEEELTTLRDALGLRSRVTFLGFVEDVPEFLRDADLFLAPSHWEGFGLSVVEAMNAGLPVVVSPAAGLRDVVRSAAPCGIFVQPDDPAAIAEGLKHLLDDREKRLEYGKNAFMRAKSFSIDEMVRKYKTFYESARLEA